MFAEISFLISSKHFNPQFESIIENVALPLFLWSTNNPAVGEVREKNMLCIQSKGLKNPIVINTGSDCSSAEYSPFFCLDQESSRRSWKKIFASQKCISIDYILFFV